MKRDRIDIRKPNDYLRPLGQFEGTPRTTMDINTTSKHILQPKGKDSVLAASRSTGTSNRKQHMHSQVTLGYDHVYMAVTNVT
jgi:hypothetical protein